LSSSTAATRPLTEADLPGCLELSRSAQWNQNEADWRMMLALGRGWGIDAEAVVAGSDAGIEAAAVSGKRRLAASVVVIPYRLLPGDPVGAAAGSDASSAAPLAGCAWVSMVLVLPQFKRRGLATQVLRHALEYLRAARLAPVLDATPAGYPVYLQEGFGPAWGFRRYRREPVALDPDAADAPRTRLVEARDWPGVMAFDAPAFGADRERLLRLLADRMPQAARVAEQDGRITGFVFGRDGREASQIGPLVAQSPQVAQDLLDDVLASVAGAVQVDLADRYLALLQGLVARGFVLQRPFTRMTTAAAPPGAPARVVLVAGPELG